MCASPSAVSSLTKVPDTESLQPLTWNESASMLIESVHDRVPLMDDEQPYDQALAEYPTSPPETPVPPLLTRNVIDLPWLVVPRHRPSRGSLLPGVA